MLWMKMKLNGAPRRNRSRWCSEVWEYQNQDCKGTCTTFLVSHGPFGSATKINQKRLVQDFLGWKRFVRKKFSKICVSVPEEVLDVVFAPEAQLRRRCDSLRRSRPPWLAASGDRRAAEVAASRPGRHKRLGFVGGLGEEHGVGESPSAPHPRWRSDQRLVQGRGSANTRSHRYRSHWWPGSLGELHRATTAPFVKHGRVWWAEILGKAGKVDGAGFGRNGRVWWRSSDGQMVKDRTRWPLRHRGGVWPFPAIRTFQADACVDGVAMPMAGTTLLRRVRDSTVQPGAEPSEALRGVRKVGHA